MSASCRPDVLSDRQASSSTFNRFSPAGVRSEKHRNGLRPSPPPSRVAVATIIVKSYQAVNAAACRVRQPATARMPTFPRPGTPNYSRSFFGIRGSLDRPSAASSRHRLAFTRMTRAESLTFGTSKVCDFEPIQYTRELAEVIDDLARYRSGAPYLEPTRLRTNMQVPAGLSNTCTQDHAHERPVGTVTFLDRAGIKVTSNRTAGAGVYTVIRRKWAALASHVCPAEAHGPSEQVNADLDRSLEQAHRRRRRPLGLNGDEQSGATDFGRPPNPGPIATELLDTIIFGQDSSLTAATKREARSSKEALQRWPILGELERPSTAARKRC